MNKNLHSKTALTEFARDFDEDKDTYISKLVNKITVVYNNVNSYPTTSSDNSPTQSIIIRDEISSTLSSSTSTSAISIPSASTNSLPSYSDIKEPTSSQEPFKDATVEAVEYPVDISQARTPVNVIRRISNIIAMKNKDLNDYKNTDLQKFWMPDAKSKECYECSQKFSTFR